MNSPLEATLCGLRSKLEFVGPIDKYKRELYRNGQTPRYVWVPVGGPCNGPRSPGRNPRNAALWACRVDVHCFAVDDQQGWRLSQALRSALHQLFVGRSFDIKSIVPSNPAWLTNGVVWVVQIELSLDVPEAELPTGPGEPIADNEITTVRPIAVEQITPPLSTSGDGLLEGTET